MEGTPSEPNQPPPFVRTRRRWFRFSLRTMLVAITLFCIWLGVTANRANRQRRAVETTRSYGAYVRYDYEMADTGWVVRRDNPLPPGPVDAGWFPAASALDELRKSVTYCAKICRNIYVDNYLRIINVPIYLREKPKPKPIKTR
jgi:hypothetical protein